MYEPFLNLFRLCLIQPHLDGFFPSASRSRDSFTDGLDPILERLGRPHALAYGSNSFV